MFRPNDFHADLSSWLSCRALNATLIARIEICLQSRLPRKHRGLIAPISGDSRARKRGLLSNLRVQRHASEFIRGNRDTRARR